MEEIKTRYIGRKEELDLIRGVLKNMLSEAASKKKKEDLGNSSELYFFYGEAGVGKSSLLKMLQEDYENNSSAYAEGAKAHFINWNYEWSYTIIEVLVSLRKLLSDKLKYSFYDFDYIIYQYYTHMGEEYGLPKIDSLSDKLEENSVTKIINIVSDYIPNASIVKNIGDIFTNAATAIKNKKLDEKYADIDKWTSEQYESEAINLFIKEYNDNVIARKDIVVLEFDTFEVLESSLKRRAWILNKELFKHLSQTISIIAGRNKPDLVVNTADNGKAIVAKELFGFTNEEIKEYIASIDPDIDEDLKMHIYKSSHTKSDDYGSPLYLAICKNIYQNLKESGAEPCEEDFSPVFSDLVDRLLSYKTKEETDILTVLATLETWTNDFAYSILEKLLIPSFLINYDDALKSEFIKRLDADIASIKAYEERYIMDKTLSETISHKMGAFFKYKIAQMATDYYLIDSKNSLGKTKDYIKWKLRTLDEDEIMPLFEREFEDFEAGPLKDLEGGMKSSYFLRKYILDMFIDEVKSLKAKWRLVYKRSKFFENDKIRDYISAIADYEMLFDITKKLSTEDLKDNAKNTKDIFGFGLSFSTKENMLYKIKENIANLYKRMNETDKAFEACKQGLDAYESPSFEQVSKAKFFSNFVKELKNDKFYELALNKELEIIYALYNEERDEEADENENDYLDLLFRASEIYKEQENYDKAIDVINSIIVIRQDEIKNDTEEDNQKAYYYEKLIETYTKLAELLNEAQREDEANKYWHKIINEGIDVLKQKLFCKRILNMTIDGNKSVIEENLGININRSLLKAGLALYKSSDYIEVFDLYKKIFSNEYDYKDQSLEKSVIRNLFYEERDKGKYFEKLIDALLEKDEAKKYEKEINELAETLIKAKYEENLEDIEKLKFKVDVLKKQRDFYEKAGNLAKAIEITKEIINIKEENKDEFKYVDLDFDKLIKLLEKAGEKDEALKITLKLEEEEYKEGCKKFNYSVSTKFYNKFKESGKLELYTKFYEDFCEKLRSDKDSQPIQILFTLYNKLRAFEYLEDADKNEKAYNDLLNFYKENYYGTIEEKIDKINSEKNEINIAASDILSELESSCKFILRNCDDIENISCEDITTVAVDRAFYAILIKMIEVEKQKVSNMVWVTGKPYIEITEVYSYAYENEDEKEKVLQAWSKRCDEIKERYGEKSYENFFAHCYSLLGVFKNDNSDKNLSNFLAYLDEAKDFVDEQELITAKEDMLRSCRYILKDKDLIALYDEVYKYSVDTKGEKARESVDIQLKYAKELKRRGLNEKALELLKNVDDLGESDDITELKAIKEEIQKKFAE